MTGPRALFIAAVLGKDGAAALAKAEERSREIGTALLPRTIVSWLTLWSPYGYDGALPGLDGTRAGIMKSEAGYTGSVSIGERSYAFENADVYHVAGSIEALMGETPQEIDPNLKDLDLEKLGRSIDLLAKSALANKLAGELDKAADGYGPPVAPRPQEPPVPHTPKAPPTPAKAPRKSKLKIPKIPKNTINITKAEAAHVCDVCGDAQFTASAFVGCTCFKDLAKSVMASPTSTGYLLRFGSDWDQDAVATFLELIGRTHA